jgi:homoserine kinase type II
MAVYTDVSDEDLAAFLTHYDIGEAVAFKGIAEGVSNSNFLLETDAGRYILTLYEARVEDRDLPFFLSLMRHVAVNGIACPQPVDRRDGTPLGRLCGRPAVIVSYLEGMAVKRPTADHCAMLGEAMARLHLATQTFAPHRHNALGQPAWQPLFAPVEHQADMVSHGLADVIRDELSALAAAWPGDLPSGVVHADLFPDNVFFLKGRLSGLIDFYFACNDALAYDLAIAVNAWCFEADYSFNQTKGRALIAGYERVRPLEAAEVEALPVLCRGAALRFLLTRLVDWLNVPPGALVKPHDPIAYYRRLRVHRRLASAREYGVIR